MAVSCGLVRRPQKQEQPGPLPLRLYNASRRGFSKNPRFPVLGVKLSPGGPPGQLPGAARGVGRARVQPQHQATCVRTLSSLPRPLHTGDTEAGGGVAAGGQRPGSLDDHVRGAVPPAPGAASDRDGSSKPLLSRSAASMYGPLVPKADIPGPLQAVDGTEGPRRARLSACSAALHATRRLPSPGCPSCRCFSISRSSPLLTPPCWPRRALLRRAGARGLDGCSAGWGGALQAGVQHQDLSCAPQVRPCPQPTGPPAGTARARLPQPLEHSPLDQALHRALRASGNEGAGEGGSPGSIWESQGGCR